ncbi:hypothetical protein chiPu_0022555, partial [Chiloscyllium punctatum]|nr:hypothetical protein [Chiloscyllium punctatum]
MDSPAAVVFSQVARMPGVVVASGAGFPAVVVFLRQKGCWVFIVVSATVIPRVVVLSDAKDAGSCSRFRYHHAVLMFLRTPRMPGV